MLNKSNWNSNHIYTIAAAATASSSFHILNNRNRIHILNARTKAFKNTHWTTKIENLNTIQYIVIVSYSLNIYLLLSPKIPIFHLRAVVILRGNEKEKRTHTHTLFESTIHSSNRLKYWNMGILYLHTYACICKTHGPIEYASTNWWF